MPLSTQSLQNAAQKGLAYLAKTQQESGEFIAYRSTRLDMSDATPFTKSVYISAGVIHALCYAPQTDLARPLQDKAAAFLMAQKEDDGSWNYDGRGNWTVPADLDETACVQAGLIRLGNQPGLNFFNLLWQNEAKPGGPYYTWIGVNDRPDYPHAKQLDTLVNANLLYCCGLLNIQLPGAVDYIRQTIAANAFSEGGMYCPHPHFLMYSYSRAFADGGIAALAPSMPALQAFALEQLPSPDKEVSAFNLACLTVTLLNLNAPLSVVTPYLESLLKRQQADGSWPLWAIYIGYAPDFHGSPAISAAIAIEAIGKYLHLAQS